MKRIDMFSKEEIEQICKESKNQASVSERLGYSRVGGSTQKLIKEYVKSNNIDVSHFTGQGWNKNNVDLTRFRKGNAIKNLKDTLLIIRPYQCECCGNTEQMSKKIPLEVHHINGDHLDNELDNLQLLCPNCHAQTDNQCGRNINQHKHVSDEDFIAALKDSSSIREALKKVGINYSSQCQYEKARQIMYENEIEFPKK